MEQAPDPSDASTTTPPLFKLPPELTESVLNYLSPSDLARLSATCHYLREYANSTTRWQAIVQAQVPGVKLTEPAPFSSFRQLYSTYDRLWFLSKYKLWFCDRGLIGKVLLVRYDHRRGCIEGYQLVANRTPDIVVRWAEKPDVIIHAFDPEVKLHLDKPILRFHHTDSSSREYKDFATRPEANRYADEMPMALDDRRIGMFSNFLLTRQRTNDELKTRDIPSMYGDYLWPPMAIPTDHRTFHALVDEPMSHYHLPVNDRPMCREDSSDRIFRLRQWMELGAAVSSHMGSMGGFVGLMHALSGAVAPEPSPTLGLSVAGGGGMKIGEEINTYSTLDPSLYTPTETKPWRGIWVGDYSAHACEFLVIYQSDDTHVATEEELGLEREEDETDDAWQRKIRDARVNTGSMTAVKLMGDPNVPRGQVSFRVDDIGPRGLVGYASQAPFAGARIVRGKGHIAETGFERGTNDIPPHHSIEKNGANIFS